MRVRAMLPVIGMLSMTSSTKSSTGCRIAIGPP